MLQGRPHDSDGLTGWVDVQSICEDRLRLTRVIDVRKPACGLCAAAFAEALCDWHMARQNHADTAAPSGDHTASGGQSSCCKARMATRCDLFGSRGADLHETVGRRRRNGNTALWGGCGSSAHGQRRVARLDTVAARFTGRRCTCVAGCPVRFKRPSSHATRLAAVGCAGGLHLTGLERRDVQGCGKQKTPVCAAGARGHLGGLHSHWICKAAAQRHGPLLTRGWIILTVSRGRA